jgi:hypothetical protein
MRAKKHRKNTSQQIFVSHPRAEDIENGKTNTPPRALTNCRRMSGRCVDWIDWLSNVIKATTAIPMPRIRSPQGEQHQIRGIDGTPS